MRLAADTGPTTGPTPVMDTGPSVGGSLFNPLGDIKLWDLVLKILNFVIEIGAVVIVFMVVYVGFLFVVAQGNESKLSEAKKALLWTIVGALILLGAKAITLGICATAQALSTSSAITCPTTF